MTKTRTIHAASLALGTAGLLFGTAAFAQPATTPAAQPTPAPTPAPAPAPVYQPVAPAPAPAPVYQEPEAAPVVAKEEVPDTPATARPAGMSFGLGLGYFLNGTLFGNGGVSSPVDLMAPTGASVRVRLDSGLTLAPFVRLATHGQSTMGGDNKNAQNELVLGSEVRYPLKSRGKVDLVAVGNGALAVQADDPDGDDNNSTVTGFLIGYGLSVEYWYSSNWCLSFTAANPIFRLDSRSFEISGDQTATNIDVGLIWDPDTNVALHLFY